MSARAAADPAPPSRASAPPRSRSGIVLYLVLGVLATVGSILFLLHASFTTWDRRLHVDTDEVVARHLATGAVEALLFAAEVELDRPEGRPRIDPERGTLGEVVLGDARTLARVFGAGGRPASARRLLEQLLGPRAFGPIDLLAASHPAELTYRVSLRSSPPPTARAPEPPTALADPVLKTLTLEFECTCQLRHARRVAKSYLELRVGSILPGVLGRFTLAWSPGASTATNLVTVDRAGGPLSLAHPLVAFNDPADYHPGDPLWTGRADRERSLSVPGFTKVADLEKQLAGRGAVFLTGADRTAPLIFQIAAGGPPAGQTFQVMAAVAGKAYQPEPQSVPSQPGRITSMRPSQPGTSTRQNAWIEGMVTGFYRGVNGRGQLGTDALAGPLSEGSSYLRPLGTAARPSLALVYGHARARLAAVSNLAVDRDQTRKDENDQERSVGFPLPLPEVREPPMRHVTAASFAAELARERGNQPLQDLFYFGSEILGPGLAPNRNLAATSEDGRQMLVSSERRFPRIALLRLFYKYGKLFNSYAEYERVMSRRLEFSYNSLLRFVALDGAAAQRLLMSRAFAASTPPDDSDMMIRAHMEHADPLHAQLGATSLFVDSGRAQEPDTALGDLVRSTSSAPRSFRTSVTCHGLDLFRSSFLASGNLDLGGWWVGLAGTTVADPEPALGLERVTVAPLGGGVLKVRELSLTGLKNAGTGAQLEPLVVKVGTLKLKGLGPYEGTFIVSDRLEVQAGPEGHAVMRGNLVLAPGAVLDLAMPLAVVRDPALDPTGPEAHLYYRATLVSAWDRNLTGGSDPIARNPHRRAEPAP